jgi:hypothetical protein
VADTDQERLGAIPYLVAGMSFIPLIGVLFGLVAIVWGLVTPKRGGKRIAAIGSGGIAFTIVLYGALFYFVFAQRGGIYDELRTKLAQSSINSLVPMIEFYKIQNGKYPESLEALRASLPKDTFAMVFDPSVPSGLEARPRYFFYERVGDDHYYLRGLGADGQPFTADDIVPQVPSAPDSKLGLIIQRQSQ